jgi:FlaG/FlaF family flagellin (archaellin)
MVAITVILAAVIAAFVLGLGDTNSSTPNVTWEYDYDASSDTLNITNTGGESFDPNNVEFQISGSNDVAENTIDATSSSSPVVTNDISNPSTAGDSIVLELDGNRNNDGQSTDDFELDIIFTSEDGGTSSTIGGTTGPDA